jgi:hypothetical protein
MWLSNRERLGEFFARGDWLVLSLERLLVRLGQQRSVLPAEHEERVAEELERLFEEERLFSIVPLQLAQRDELEFVSNTLQESNALCTKSSI